MTLEERKQHADQILDSLADVPPGALRLTARALAIGGGELAGFGGALDSFADSLEDDDVSRDLARLLVAYQIRQFARDEDFIERLADATEPPWPALRDALLAERDSTHGAGHVPGAPSEFNVERSGDGAPGMS